MKIHMEAVTLLSVLFATSSVLAAADVQQQDRQLKPKRSKKSKKTDAPTSTPTSTPTPLETDTLFLRVVLDADPIILAPTTDGGFPSFIGSRSIISGDVFDRDPEREGEPLPFRYTQICTITEGTFPIFIERNNCDISLCLTAPLIGGCAFYKSGGNFPFTIGEPVPTVIATKTGGTGVLGFDTGPEFLTISSAGTASSSLSVVPSAFLDVDLTAILPRENIERNVMLATTVPGESQVILHFYNASLVPSSIQHTLNAHVYF